MSLCRAERMHRRDAKRTPPILTTDFPAPVDGPKEAVKQFDWGCRMLSNPIYLCSYGILIILLPPPPPPTQAKTKSFRFGTGPWTPTKPGRAAMSVAVSSAPASAAASGVSVPWQNQPLPKSTGSENLPSEMRSGPEKWKDPRKKKQKKNPPTAGFL